MEETIEVDHQHQHQTDHRHHHHHHHHHHGAKIVSSSRIQFLYNFQRCYSQVQCVSLQQIKIKMQLAV
jgi:hypothetical protein